VNRTFVYPYNKNSESAKRLADALGVKRIKVESSTYKPRATDVLVNFGSSSMPNYQPSVKVINQPSSVIKSIDKLITFQTLEGKCSIPQYTQDKQEALDWGSEFVACRTLVNSSGGRGLSVHHRDVLGDLDTSDVKLYTSYIKKKHEYRVHIVANKIISVQRKKLRGSTHIVDDTFKIRNIDHGWVFSRNFDRGTDDYSDDVEDQALFAMNELGLDYGAVDILFNQLKGVYVVEVNTAPGLQDVTLDLYKEAFKSEYNIGAVS